MSGHNSVIKTVPGSRLEYLHSKSQLKLYAWRGLIMCVAGLVCIQVVISHCIVWQRRVITVVFSNLCVLKIVCFIFVQSLFYFQFTIFSTSGDEMFSTNLNHKTKFELNCGATCILWQINVKLLIYFCNFKVRQAFIAPQKIL